MQRLKFIDLFAGIGGFHLAFHNLGAECVYVSEIDKHARATYKYNFEKISPNIFRENNLFDGADSDRTMNLFNEDITKQEVDEIPDFDILCAGFPCQPFSNAGFKKGFEDTRGTLFFNVADIIAKKQPEAFFLENVRGLYSHDKGKTFETIRRVIEEDLGYSFYYKIVKASDYGLPQYRPRIFMVGFKDKNINFSWPEKRDLKYTMSDVMGGKVDKKVGYTLRCGGRGSGVGDRRNWDGYIVDGKEQKLNSKQGLMMQGFPQDFYFPVTESQAMKQLGNSVAVDAIQAVAENIVSALDRSNRVKVPERVKNSKKKVSKM